MPLLLKTVTVSCNYMRRQTFIIFLFIASSSFAQKTTIRERLKLADTVLLISHDYTSNTRSVVIVDSTGKTIKQPDLVRKGKLNEQVVKERRVLSKEEISSLSKILSYKYKPTKVVVSSGCFDPHHSIIIISKSKANYIDLCFHCWNYITSVEIQDVEIRDDKLEKLYDLFKQLGFTYEMNFEN